MTGMRIAALAAFFLNFVSAAFAVTPGEMLSDPTLEARAREVSKELRCVVCQNQSIDDSNAPLAHDMRLIVRERILAGDSNEEVKAFLVSRYGEFVLLKPPLKGDTLILWFGPLLMFGAAAGGFAIYFKKRRAHADPAHIDALSDEEAKCVAGIRERLSP